MKVSVLLVVLVAMSQMFSQLSQAQVLSVGGAPAHCFQVSDVSSANRGYSVFSPVVSIENNNLVVAVQYLFVVCQKQNDGTIGFARTAGFQADKFLFENPRGMFSVDTTIVDFTANNNFMAVEMNLQNLLTRNEQAKLASGQSINKHMFIRYGNYMEGSDPAHESSYLHSAGYWILEYKLQGNQVELISFSAR